MTDKPTDAEIEAVLNDPDQLDALLRRIRNDPEALRRVSVRIRPAKNPPPLSDPEAA